MDSSHEIAQLKAQVDQLTAENAALREDGFRGSKAEALMALEYDRIPTFMKSQKAIAWQRKIATAVMIVVPLILVAVAVFGGCMPIGTISSAKKSRKGWSGFILPFRLTQPLRPRNKALPR
jgi:outer membrane murein-binding lipoprotein Lpp